MFQILFCIVKYFMTIFWSVRLVKRSVFKLWYIFPW